MDIRCHCLSPSPWATVRWVNGLLKVMQFSQHKKSSTTLLILLNQCFSKCGPWTNSISIIPNLLGRTSGSGPSNVLTEALEVILRHTQG